jgi:very-short-patch-repair endonuclease
VASHRSAALVHALDLLGRCEFEVTVPACRNPKPPSGAGRELVLVHRSFVPERERRIVSRVPCTSLAWTCLDLAATLDPVAVAVAIESAWRRKPNDMIDWLSRLARENKNGKRGMGVLQAVLAGCMARGKPMRSSFEVQFWHYLIGRRSELELPIPGHIVRDAVGKMELDFAWLRQKVAVETNGWGVHGTWKAFNSDADRTSRLLALGWRVLPVTFAMFDKAPDAVFERVRTTVARAEASLVATASTFSSMPSSSAPSSSAPSRWASSVRACPARSAGARW